MVQTHDNKKINKKRFTHTTTENKNKTERLSRHSWNLWKKKLKCTRVLRNNNNKPIKPITYSFCCCRCCWCRRRLCCYLFCSRFSPKGTPRLKKNLLINTNVSLKVLSDTLVYLPPSLKIPWCSKKMFAANAQQKITSSYFDYPFQVVFVFVLFFIRSSKAQKWLLIQ